MRVLLISKALVVGSAQRKAEELARLPGVELLVVTPPAWLLEGTPQRLERRYTAGYELAVEPIALNGHFHTHFYPLLGRRLRAFRPDLVHIDEEAYNLATFQALLLARGRGARTVFFTWQNLDRRYPPPFSTMERYVLARADGCIAGNDEAAAIQRRRGFRGALRVIPQFGVDPELFQPAPQPHDDFVVGGIGGRFVEEKGVRVLCAAFERLPADCRLLLAGFGPLEDEVRRRAATAGWADRLAIEQAPSTRMPALYNRMDCFVLPSLTRPNWKEQFGRAIVEAMACELPVVGSSSGEIPEAVGDAGLIVPEGDAAALTEALLRLRADAAERRRLGRVARARVLARFTQARIARATWEFYRDLLA
ncbi:MAG: glycosyltransferase family 4 protein [Chloroflexi bacterium]|nr:glycosyltransferase family 4 protein [Chloroflexota bacterium]